jgi:hypothetical protein
MIQCFLFVVDKKYIPVTPLPQRLIFEGVRVYTLVMHTSVITSTAQTEPAKIVLDWSHVLTNATLDTEEQEIEALLSWVRTYPNASALHVYVRNLKKQQGQTRRLMSTLRSMGCTVTMRSSLRGVHKQQVDIHEDFKRSLPLKRGAHSILL